MNIIALLKSAGIFSGALLVSATQWRILQFLADWDPGDGRGLWFALLLLGGGLLVGFLCFRRPGSAAARVATAAILFLSALLIPFGEAHNATLWWAAAVILTLPAGVASAYFLRGGRSNRTAIIAGFTAVALGGMVLTEGRLWYWLPADFGFFFALGCLLTAAWRYPFSSVKWLALVCTALVAGLFYLNQPGPESQSTPDDHEIRLDTVDGGRRLIPLFDGTGNAYRLGGQWAGSYPRDYDSRPAALPTLLQFANHNLQILAVTAPFSIWPQELARYPWVSRIDSLTSDPALARVNGNLFGFPEAEIAYLGQPAQTGGPYDLIVVTEGSPLKWLKDLMPNGVLAVTPYTDTPQLAEHFAYDMTVPGPGLVRLYSNRPLESDLKKLDEHMLLASMGATPFQSGVLDLLYQLPNNSYTFAPPAVPDNAVAPWPPPAWLRPPVFSDATPWLWYGLGLALLLAARLARFLLDRWAVWHAIDSDVDAGLTAGFSLGIVLVALTLAGQPLLIRISAVGLATVLLLPHRSLPPRIRRVAGWLIWLAPLAAVGLLRHAPWEAFGVGAVGLAALAYWQQEHTSHAPLAVARILFGALLALGLLLGSLHWESGLWLAAFAVTFWRKTPL